MALKCRKKPPLEILLVLLQQPQTKQKSNILVLIAKLKFTHQCRDITCQRYVPVTSKRTGTLTQHNNPYNRTS